MVLLSPEDAGRVVGKFVDDDDNVRLHSAIGFVTPRQKLEDPKTADIFTPGVAGWDLSCPVFFCLQECGFADVLCPTRFFLGGGRDTEEEKKEAFFGDEVSLGYRGRWFLFVWRAQEGNQ